jgi:hypothetical protein
VKNVNHHPPSAVSNANIVIGIVGALIGGFLLSFSSECPSHRP